jgi:hypothetical protein
VVLAGDEKTKLDKELLKVSLGPIAPWLGDPAVTDILVYGSHLFAADLNNLEKIVPRVREKRRAPCFDPPCPNSQGRFVERAK